MPPDRDGPRTFARGPSCGGAVGYSAAASASGVASDLARARRARRGRLGLGQLADDEGDRLALGPVGADGLGGFAVRVVGDRLGLRCGSRLGLGRLARDSRLADCVRDALAVARPATSSLSDGDAIVRFPARPAGSVGIRRGVGAREAARERLRPDRGQRQGGGRGGAHGRCQAPRPGMGATGAGRGGFGAPGGGQAQTNHHRSHACPRAEWMASTRKRLAS
jgi:hypothetical protein